MLHNMADAARLGGLGCLYHGYLAFLAKSLPYDVAELFTYSQLSALEGGGALHAMPAGCRDMLIGAATFCHCHTALHSARWVACASFFAAGPLHGDAETEGLRWVLAVRWTAF